MKYTKYEIGPYNLHIINTDKFKTVTVKFNFKRELLKKEITYRNLVNNILTQSSKKYPTRRLLEIRTEELYDMRVKSKSFISGNYSVLSFEGKFLLEDFTEKGMLDKSIEFLCDIIFDPKVENKKFSQNDFVMATNSIRDEIESFKDNPNKYSLTRMLESMDNKSPISFQTVGYMKDLETIDSTKLFEYYESIIRSDLLDIFVIGNVENDVIKNMIVDKVKVNTLKKPGISHFIEHDKYRKRARIVKEEKDISQSRLVIGYKLGDLTDFETKYVSLVYSFILGGSADSRLFKVVREKNSLCYSVSSSISVVSNLLIINAGIDKKDYEKAVKLIRKEVKNMEKGLFEDIDIDKARSTYYNSCKQILDSPGHIINTFISHEYLNTDLIEKRMEEINKVTKEMVINFAKKVHVDTVYLLEGGIIDEEDIPQ